MKKPLSLFYLLIFINFFSLQLYAQSYNPLIDYNKGDETTIIINDILVTLEYLNDISTLSLGYDANPNNSNTEHLWSISRNYTGEWVPYHYVLFNGSPTIVTYAGNTYELKTEVWKTAEAPAQATWEWECLDCPLSPTETCGNIYSTDYFPINLARQNNGTDNTSPANASGNGSIISVLGANFIQLNQTRLCNTPFVLFNNDLYLRESCDQYAGLGYYGRADNSNTSVPQKRFFADVNIDGPVLYGWNGGALGVRQRTDLDATNGVNVEKIALQWTPKQVSIGTDILPMDLSVTGRIKQKISDGDYGIILRGSNEANNIYCLNNENKLAFRLKGNGDMTVNGNSSFSKDLTLNARLWIHAEGSYKNTEWPSEEKDNGLNIWGNTQIMYMGVDSDDKVSYIQSVIYDIKPSQLSLNPRGGTVSIGTIKTTKSEKFALTVGGGIIAENITVRLKEYWPDYVFNTNYKLIPLNELENYINENKHLPGIPSAKEINEEGVDLGEMNKLLLEKVEELTLYIIQLQKEIDELKKQ
ncbi:MAG: hypothetical protein PF481_10925 [Bacteroidales bacterium]|jgi:hypothetical protein|nr:hypothetical protein [Bacteroidales bacterium]